MAGIISLMDRDWRGTRLIKPRRSRARIMSWTVGVVTPKKR